MFYADQIGLDTVVAGLKKYAGTGLARDWEPAKLLRELAESGSTFAAWAESRKG